MNDWLIVYIERSVDCRIDNKKIMHARNDFKLWNIIGSKCKTFCISVFVLLLFFDNVDIFKFYFVLNFEYFMFLIDPLKNNFGADTTLINSYVF